MTRASNIVLPAMIATLTALGYAYLNAQQRQRQGPGEDSDADYEYGENSEAERQIIALQQRVNQLEERVDVELEFNRRLASELVRREEVLAAAQDRIASDELLIARQEQQLQEAGWEIEF